MPIRIKDIANTASASSTLDFFAIDGNTNNTRKLSAFSPSFGGSVAIGGSLQINNPTIVFGSKLDVLGVDVAADLTSSAASGLGITLALRRTNGGELIRFINGAGSTQSGFIDITAGTGAMTFKSIAGLTVASNAGVTLSGTSYSFAAAGAVTISSTASSNNTASGALQVLGGVGVGGSVYANGPISTYSGGATRTSLNTDGTLFWGVSANLGVLTWDTNKARVGAQGTADFALTTGTSTDRLRISGTTGDVTIINNATVNGSLTASDYLLSGSSASLRGAVADRAVRQELVFDGTKGVACSTPILSGDWSVAFVVNRATAAVQQYLIGNDVSGCFYLGFRTNGNLFSGKALGSANTDLTLGNVVGVTQHIVVVRSGNTITAYSNGAAVGTTTDAQTYSVAAATLFAADSAGSAAFNGTGALVGFYNRALSATEVAALYANGTPSSFDYWAAGSGVNAADCGTLAVFNGATYSSSTSTSITGLNLPAINGQVQIGGGYPTVKGQRVRVTFSVTGVTDPSQIWIRWVSAGPETWVPINTAGVTGSSGTYTYEHTTEVSAANYIQFRNFGTVAQNGINVTNWSAITIGLRVAPDAAQPGSGLTWYDASNNSLHLTLPATGVLWSVRTSGRIGGPLTIGTTASGGAKLNVYATPAEAGYLYGIRLSDESTATLAFGLQTPAGATRPFIHGNSGLGFGTSGAAALNITSAQQVQVLATTNASTFDSGALVVSGGIGAGGAIFTQQNSNAIVNGLNAANTNTGNAATLRHTLTAGTNTSTIEAYSNGHATFPGRLRFGTNNGQMDFVPSGVLGLSISASALTTPVGLFTVSKAGAGSTVEINSDSGFTSKLSFQRAATNRWTFEADSADILAFKYLGTTSALSATSTSGNVVLTLGPAGAAYTHYLHGATAGGAIQFVCDPATTNRYLSLGSVNNSYVYTEMLRLDNTGAAFFTGSLNVGGQANFNGPFLTLNNTVQNRGLLVSTSGSNRWFVYVDGGTESGSNVGSNFSISAYSDAGGFLSTPVTIFRNSGRVVLSSTTNSTGTSSGALVVSGGVGVAGSINAGTTGTNYSHVFTGGDLGSGSIILAARDSNGTNQFIVGGSGVVQITNSLQLNGASNVFRIVNSQTPASQTATGTTGQITWDSSYIYVCTATNNWGRSSLSWSGGGGGGGTSAQVDTYTTTGSVLTWTKPAGAKAVTIIANGGGGQGGGGALVAIGASFGNGGGGGGGGAMNIKTFAADSLPSALYVTVGAGGSTGGLGASGTVPAIGTAGQAGGNSVVATNNTPSPTTGLLIIAGGGGGGKGGQDATNSVGGGGGGTGGAGTTGTGTTSVAGGAGIGGAGATGQGNNNGQPSEWGGGGGTGAGSSNANIFGGGSSIHGGGGGGMAGAGFNTTGGAGGASGTWGTGGGGAGGATDAAGTAGASATTLYSSGAGGGGAGRKNVAGNGFAGGAGGFPSGGGGGGGFARDTGFTGGAGGAGGNGRVIIITYF
jgi:hypothetical protein